MGSSTRRSRQRKSRNKKSYLGTMCLFARKKKTGYKIGIVEGKEVNMQKGFDEGYKDGLSIGKAVGKLRGVVG